MLRWKQLLHNRSFLNLPQSEELGPELFMAPPGPVLETQKNFQLGGGGGFWVALMEFDDVVCCGAPFG